MKYKNAIILILVIIIADQALKVFIKTHFANGDEVKIMGDWFRLHFIENEGMAYGLKISSTAFGKFLLTSFRLVAVIFGFFLLHKLVKQGYGKVVITCGALILAGALGNLLDSLFYGALFTDSPLSCFSGNFENLKALLNDTNPRLVAKLTRFGQGYGPLMHGKVVDMLYFPLLEIREMPRWIPFLGGKPFVFFEPVFNIADAAISVGVITLVIRVYFYKLLLQLWKSKTKNKNSDTGMVDVGN